MIFLKAQKSRERKWENQMSWRNAGKCLKIKGFLPLPFSSSNKNVPEDPFEALCQQVTLTQHCARPDFLFNGRVSTDRISRTCSLLPWAFLWSRNSGGRGQGEKIYVLFAIKEHQDRGTGGMTGHRANQPKASYFLIVPFSVLTQVLEKWKNPPVQPWPPCPHDAYINQGSDSWGYFILTSCLK